MNTIFIVNQERKKPKTSLRNIRAEYLTSNIHSHIQGVEQGQNFIGNLKSFFAGLFSVVRHEAVTLKLSWINYDNKRINVPISLEPRFLL